MADVNKTKLHLRSGLPMNGDKTPSPATRLLINHGKPNFTIPRSIKTQNGNVSPAAPNLITTLDVQHNNNRNGFLVKSATLNGAFKSLNISTVRKQNLPYNGNMINNNNDGAINEASKVVLRRAKVEQATTREDEDENVPEFIRRQRRIQERLANQNILDFENRRSGYFTQVLISPTSPNRQSFVETMASPAVKPGLEIPPKQEYIKEEALPKLQENEKQFEFKKSIENMLPETITINGHLEEEEVAKAIEEVNKAVEGEDDDKTDIEDQATVLQQEIEQNIECTNGAAVVLEDLEKTKVDENETQGEVTALIQETVEIVTEQKNGPNTPEEDTVPDMQDITDETKSECIVEKQHIDNGHLKDEEVNLHKNGLTAPSIPSPDPKGEKGVNFEPKTVVSFSHELGNDDNKYPDKVTVVKNIETSETSDELKQLSKLKFEIKSDNKDIEVKPILITENV